MASCPCNGSASIAGAAIVVVKDSKILFSKGYGYSDDQRR
jgi:hypothetical protein